jgi:hypothetical protein
MFSDFLVKTLGLPPLLRFLPEAMSGSWCCTCCSPEPAIAFAWWRLSIGLRSDVGGPGTKKDVRRGDAIIVPLQYLTQDPVKLMLGLGIGAVSPSQLGKNFEGAYYMLFVKFTIISFTTFMLEFGLLGLMVIGALFWMVFSDTLTVLRRDDSLVGALAAGWSGVVVIFAIDVFYTNFHEFASITYLYWYFSGLICARCVALAYEGRRPRHSAAIREKGPAELAASW